MKRRNLLKVIGASAFLPGVTFSRLGVSSTDKPLNILFMGGTGFIGPHMVRALLAAGHNVTLFNRGKSHPGLFSELTRITGDRNSDDIKQVSGTAWDVVVDTSCYIPRSVNLLMEQLNKQALQHYVFISTISVYSDFSKPGLKEDSELATMADPASEDVGANYGALKVLCEQAAEAHMPGKVTEVRCGLIVGPGDSTDRFTYWPERVFRGGDVLAPGDGSQPMQTIDVRDLAQWVAHCVDQNIVGAYNATSPVGSYSIKTLLDLCRDKLNPKADIAWVPEEFLRSNDVQEMSDLPLWASLDGPMAGIWRVDSSKAIAAGLQHRPIAETVVDTHTWFQTLPEERRATLRAGISAAREQELLARWSSAGAKSGALSTEG